jgi:integrase
VTLRAPKGTGTVYERRDRPGLWVAERRARGKRERQTFRSEEDARRWLGATSAAQTFVGAGTLGAWLETWLETPRKGLEPRTLDFYRSTARRWQRSSVANRPLAKLTPEEIEDALEGWYDEVSRTTLGHLRRVLGTALNEAVDRKLLLANPIVGNRVRLPGRPAPYRVRQIKLGERVIKQLSDAWINHPYRLAWEIQLHTGIRPAEVCALDWSDIDLKGSQLSVRRAVKQRREQGRIAWYVGPPKTATSHRDLAFHVGLRPLLFERYTKQGRPKKGWLFPSAGDPSRPMNPETLSKAFRELVDTAGISVRPGDDRSELRLYDLRALHATRLISSGADPVAVAVRLGHTDIVSTLRRYAGSVVERDRQVAEAGWLWDKPRAPKALKKPAPESDRT